jgi:hypothetical protein
MATNSAVRGRSAGGDSCESCVDKVHLTGAACSHGIPGNADSTAAAVWRVMAGGERRARPRTDLQRLRRDGDRFRQEIAATGYDGARHRYRASTKPSCFEDKARDRDSTSMLLPVTADTKCNQVVQCIVAEITALP